MASKRKLRDQMNEVISKNLYLEAYSRRENIKFFSIPEEEEEDTQEVLRNFIENELGYRNARIAEIQRVHRIARRIETWCRLWHSPDNRHVPSLQGCGRHIQSGKTP